MQAPTLHDLEQYLDALYGQQKTLYTELVSITAGFPPDYAPGPQMDRQIGQMHVVMDRIGELDNQLSDLRVNWQELGGKPGPQLKATLDDVEKLMLVAMDKINAAERAAAASKERLAPQVSVESRRRQMTAAYRTAQGNG